MPDHELPQRLQNRYQLIEQLGSGGMGTVFRAHDDMLNRDVAVKFLTLEQLPGNEAGERFLREARLVARLSHPNIMTLFDMGQEARWHFLILEYIAGRNLYQRLLEQGQPFSLAVAIQMIRSILEALSYAHQQGIVHRDIKPQNVMVTPTGQVKVTDFGLAFMRGDLRLTKTGAFVGTIYYVAPEMAMGRAFDHRADLYATGAMLYELLTGTPPFAGDSPVLTLSKILNTPVPSPRLINPAIPARVENVIMRLLAKDPAERYTNAEDVLALLPVPEEAPDSERSPRLPRQDQSDPLTSNRLDDASSILHIAVGNQAARDEREEQDPQLLLYAAAEDATSALESERRQLAALLDSNVIEPLNLLLSQAMTYERTVTPQTRMAISVLTSLARQTLQQARDLGATLHPTALETLGLEPALESLVSTVIRAHGLQISLHLARLRERLPAQIELALFRAAQDALDRIVKSAHASQVTLRLEARDKHLLLTIKDNGILGAVGDELRAARRRIRQIGGRFDTTIDATGGLEITITLEVESPSQLTPREFEILQLIAFGHSNKEIARRLSVSPRTVNFHLDNLYSKLGVRSRTEAAIYALRRGWIRRPPSDPG